MNQAPLPLSTRAGYAIAALGYAMGDGNKGIWAVRLCDGALRYYDMIDLHLPEGVAHASALLPSLKPIDKAEAQEMARFVIRARLDHMPS